MTEGKLLNPAQTPQSKVSFPDYTPDLSLFHLITNFLRARAMLLIPRPMPGIWLGLTNVKSILEMPLFLMHKERHRIERALTVKALFVQGPKD